MSARPLPTLQSFSTTRCQSRGHPEVTLRFARHVPVRGLESMLLGYFERAVEAGTRFRPGETVQVGWATLRLVDRDDGTIGVEERDPDEPSGWVESVDRSLMQTWLQREVAASVGLEDRLAFPRQTQTAVVCRHVGEVPQLVLSRGAPTRPDCSGWIVRCADGAHPDDHEDDTELLCVPLLELARRLPFLAQFLALPPEVDVLVMGPGRIRAELWWQGAPRPPGPGSYLASLNAV